MYKIKMQELSREAFDKYGVYQDLLDCRSLAGRSVFSEGFFADVVTLDFARTTLPTISVCHVKRQEQKLIRFLEAHQYTCEGLLPLDADIVIFVGVLTRGEMDVRNLEAFRIPRGTFVKLDPLIVHGTQYVTDQEEAHVVCMLSGRTFKNDMLARQLTSLDEMAEIV